MTTSTSFHQSERECDIYFMKQALRVAQNALAIGEVPVGCVVVLQTVQGAVVCSHGANQVNATRDPTRHAELVAIDRMLTHGKSSDQLKLSAHVLGRRTDLLPTDSPYVMYKDDDEMLQEYLKDYWKHEDATDKDWKREHGWGTGTIYTEADFKNCCLYVTCEPCIMCAAALAQIGIGRVVYGCANDKFGGCGSILNLHQEIGNYHKGYPIVAGVCKDEAVSLLRSFYKRENFHAPDEKRKRKDKTDL
jgi:tRNA-specific adenosine deaminase 2